MQDIDSGKATIPVADASAISLNLPVEVATSTFASESSGQVASGGSKKKKNAIIYKFCKRSYDNSHDFNTCEQFHDPKVVWDKCQESIKPILTCFYLDNCRHGESKRKAEESKPLWNLRLLDPNKNPTISSVFDNEDLLVSDGMIFDVSVLSLDSFVLNRSKGVVIAQFGGTTFYFKHELYRDLFAEISEGKENYEDEEGKDDLLWEDTIKELPSDPEIFEGADLKSREEDQEDELIRVFNSVVPPMSMCHIYIDRLPFTLSIERKQEKFIGDYFFERQCNVSGVLYGTAFRAYVFFSDKRSRNIALSLTLDFRQDVDPQMRLRIFSDEDNQKSEYVPPPPSKGGVFDIAWADRWEIKMRPVSVVPGYTLKQLLSLPENLQKTLITTEFNSKIRGNHPDMFTPYYNFYMSPILLGMDVSELLQVLENPLLLKDYIDTDVAGVLKNQFADFSYDHLVTLSFGEQTEYIGHELHRIIKSRYPIRAGKITERLLLMRGEDITDLLFLLKEQSALNENIDEALKVIEETEGSGASSHTSTLSGGGSSTSLARDEITSSSSTGGGSRSSCLAREESTSPLLDTGLERKLKSSGIVIKGFSESFNDREKLKAAFNFFGAIKTCAIKSCGTDRLLSNSQAFVFFADPVNAVKAIDAAADGKLAFVGQSLTIEIAHILPLTIVDSITVSNFTSLDVLKQSIMGFMLKSISYRNKDSEDFDDWEKYIVTHYEVHRFRSSIFHLDVKELSSPVEEPSFELSIGFPSYLNFKKGGSKWNQFDDVLDQLSAYLDPPSYKNGIAWAACFQYLDFIETELKELKAKSLAFSQLKSKIDVNTNITVDPYTYRYFKNVEKRITRCIALIEEYSKRESVKKIVDSVKDQKITYISSQLDCAQLCHIIAHALSAVKCDDDDDDAYKLGGIDDGILGNTCFVELRDSVIKVDDIRADAKHLIAPRPVRYYESTNTLMREVSLDVPNDPEKRGKIQKIQVRRLIMVVHSSPETARSRAMATARLWGCDIGESIGYDMGHGDKKISGETIVVFVTESVLLSEFVKDPLLKRYRMLIVDNSGNGGQGMTINTELILIKAKVAIFSHEEMRREKSTKPYNDSTRGLRLVVISSKDELLKLKGYFESKPQKRSDALLLPSSSEAAAATEVDDENEGNDENRDDDVDRKPFEASDCNNVILDEPESSQSSQSSQCLVYEPPSSLYKLVDSESADIDAKSSFVFQAARIAVSPYSSSTTTPEYRQNTVVFLPSADHIKLAMKRCVLSLLKEGYTVFFNNSKDDNICVKTPSSENTGRPRDIIVFSFNERRQINSKKFLPHAKSMRLSIESTPKIAFCSDMYINGVSCIDQYFGDIDHVIDSGIIKEVIWDWNSHIATTTFKPISKSRAEERAKLVCISNPKSRCIRLYSQTDFESLIPKISSSELQKSPLSKTILNLIHYGHRKHPSNFKFISKLSKKGINEAVASLIELGAVVWINGASESASATTNECDDSGFFTTSLGNALVHLPFEEPAFGKVLVEGFRQGIYAESLVAAAYLNLSTTSRFNSGLLHYRESVRDQFKDFETYENERMKAYSKGGEVCTITKMYMKWVSFLQDQSCNVLSHLKKWCDDNFVNYDLLSCLYQEVKRIVPFITRLANDRLIPFSSAEETVDPQVGHVGRKIFVDGLKCLQDRYSGMIADKIGADASDEQPPEMSVSDSRSFDYSDDSDLENSDLDSDDDKISIKTKESKFTLTYMNEAFDEHFDDNVVSKLINALTVSLFHNVSLLHSPITKTRAHDIYYSMYRNVFVGLDVDSSVYLDSANIDDSYVLYSSLTASNGKVFMGGITVVSKQEFERIVSSKLVHSEKILARISEYTKDVQVHDLGFQSVPVLKMLQNHYYEFCMLGVYLDIDLSQIHLSFHGHTGALQNVRDTLILFAKLATNKVVSRPTLSGPEIKVGSANFIRDVVSPLESSRLIFYGYSNIDYLSLQKLIFEHLEANNADKVRGLPYEFRAISSNRCYAEFPSTIGAKHAVELFKTSRVSTQPFLICQLVAISSHASYSFDDQQLRSTRGCGLKFKWDYEPKYVVAAVTFENFSACGSAKSLICKAAAPDMHIKLSRNHKAAKGYPGNRVLYLYLSDNYSSERELLADLRNSCGVTQNIISVNFLRPHSSIAFARDFKGQWESFTKEAVKDLIASLASLSGSDHIGLNFIDSTQKCVDFKDSVERVIFEPQHMYGPFRFSCVIIFKNPEYCSHAHGRLKAYYDDLRQRSIVKQLDSSGNEVKPGYYSYEFPKRPSPNSLVNVNSKGKSPSLVHTSTGSTIFDHFHHLEFHPDENTIAISVPLIVFERVESSFNEFLKTLECIHKTNDGKVNVGVDKRSSDVIVYLDSNSVAQVRLAREYLSTYVDGRKLFINKKGRRFFGMMGNPNLTGNVPVMTAAIDALKREVLKSKKTLLDLQFRQNNSLLYLNSQYKKLVSADADAVDAGADANGDEGVKKAEIAINRSQARLLDEEIEETKKALKRYSDMTKLSMGSKPQHFFIWRIPADDEVIVYGHPEYVENIVKAYEDLCNIEDKDFREEKINKGLADRALAHSYKQTGLTRTYSVISKWFRSIYEEFGSLEGLKTHCGYESLIALQRYKFSPHFVRFEAVGSEASHSKLAGKLDSYYKRIEDQQVKPLDSVTCQGCFCDVEDNITSKCMVLTNCGCWYCKICLIRKIGVYESNVDPKAYKQAFFCQGVTRHAGVSKVISIDDIIAAHEYDFEGYDFQEVVDLVREINPEFLLEAEDKDEEATVRAYMVEQLVDYSLNKLKCLPKLSTSLFGQYNLCLEVGSQVIAEVKDDEEWVLCTSRCGGVYRRVDNRYPFSNFACGICETSFCRSCGGPPHPFGEPCIVATKNASKAEYEEIDVFIKATSDPDWQWINPNDVGHCQAGKCKGKMVFLWRANACPNITCPKCQTPQRIFDWVGAAKKRLMDTLASEPFKNPADEAIIIKKGKLLEALENLKHMIQKFNPQQGVGYDHGVDPWETYGGSMANISQF